MRIGVFVFDNFEPIDVWSFVQAFSISRDWHRNPQEAILSAIGRSSNIQKVGEVMATLIERYMQGEHLKVWDEIRSHDRIPDEQRDEVWLVATETMKRVARNADRIAAKLTAKGWKSLAGKLRTPPCAIDESLLLRVEEITGSSLPISLHAFWLNVGEIDFVWDYRSRKPAPNLIGKIKMEDMDPLCVGSIEALESVVDEWDEPDDFDTFRIYLAPDSLHKVNVSGGEPYGIDVPFHGADPIFDDDTHALPFVDYLRLCFRFAGFPLLERVKEQGDVQRFLADWTSDLESF